MTTKIHMSVLEILARYAGNFIMTPDIINEMLKTEDARFVLRSLKNRKVAGIPEDVSDEKLERFVRDSYRLEVITALSILKSESYLIDMRYGEKKVSGKVLKLGAKICVGEIGYCITELGVEQSKKLSG